MERYIQARNYSDVLCQLDRNFDLELPSADPVWAYACQLQEHAYMYGQEWHLEGFSECDVAKPEGLPGTCKCGACAL